MGFEKFNEYKKEAGLTNAQLAEISGVPLSTIEKISAGQTTDPKLSTIKALAKALGKKLDDFDDIIETKNVFSAQEQKLIMDYRSLDEHGKQLVDVIISTEKERCELDRKNEEEKMESENSGNGYAWVAAKGIGPHRVKSTVSDEELIEFAKKHRKLPNFD